MSVLDRIGLPGAVGIAGTVGGLATNAARQVLGLEQGPNEQSAIQDEGVATFNRFGVLRTNLFSASFEVPRIMLSGTVDPKLIRLYTEGTSLPGVQLGVSSTRRYGVGPVYKYPNDVIFNDIVLQFIVDGSGFILDFFQGWMNRIVRFEDGYSLVEGGSGNMLDPYMFEYKDQYQTKISIAVYNELRDIVTLYELDEAFPVGISDIQMGWGNNDELMRVSVQFAYTKWKQRSESASIFTNVTQAQPSGSLDVAGMLFRGSSAALMFAAIKKPDHVGDVINIVNNASLLVRSLGR